MIVRLSKHGEVLYVVGMSDQEQTIRCHRVELARRAFKEFYAQCFWSYRDDLEITEEKIPFVVRGLRLHGGHKGYRIAAELCQ